MLFSGDWPGHLQRTIESLVGEGVTAMYYNGAEGDQSPSGRPDAGNSRWERAERYGRDLGIVAWKQWQQIKPAADVSFLFRSHTITLPERTWHPDFMKTGGAEYGLSEDLFRKMLPVLFPGKIDVVSLRLGELLIVGIPGEMAASLGMKIKSEVGKKTGAKSPVIGGIADAWISYLLPADEYRKGGYEASVSFYGETLGDTMVNGAIEGASQLSQPKDDQAWRGLERHELQLEQKLLVVKGSKGVIGCPYLNIASFEKFGEACAIVPAVDTAGMLNSKVTAVTTKARELGIEVGMSGREALDRIR
jgi:uncharacterized protein YunC (DUF1805 family)